MKTQKKRPVYLNDTNVVDIITSICIMEDIVDGLKAKFPPHFFNDNDWLMRVLKNEVSLPAYNSKKISIKISLNGKEKYTIAQK